MTFFLEVIYKGNTGGSVVIPDSKIDLEFIPKSYPCPYCNEILLAEDDLRQHKIDAHPVKRPFLYINGKPIRKAEYVIRSTIKHGDIRFEDTEKIILGRGPSLSKDEFINQLVSSQEGIWDIELKHQNYSVPCRIRFEIQDEASLANIENEFYEIFSSDLNMGSCLELFHGKASQRNTARPYAASLGTYITGIMTKERLADAWLPYEEHVAKFGEAFDGLSEYNRPLAHSINSIISFMMNDFTLLEIDSGLPKLQATKQLFLGGSFVYVDKDYTREKSIPIDSTTEAIIEFCSCDKASKENNIERVKAIYKSKNIDLKDKIKAAVALWAFYRKDDPGYAEGIRKEFIHSSYFRRLIDLLEVTK